MPRGDLTWLELATKHFVRCAFILILILSVPGFSYFRNVRDYKSAICTSFKKEFFNNYKGRIDSNVSVSIFL